MPFDSPIKRKIIYIIAVAMFIEMLDATALNTSLPQIARSFQTDSISLKVAITAYLLTLGIFIPLSSWVVDRIGERKTLLLAFSVFLASSIGCASSINLTMLVIFRLCQGMGGAFLAPVARTVLVRVYGKENIIRAMTRVSIISLLALSLGPLLGGAITTYLSWRWIFWINIPFGLVGIFKILRYLPSRLNPTIIKPLNFINFLLIGGTLGSLLFFLDIIVDPKISILEKTFLVIAAIILAITCVSHTRQAQHPLLDFSVFHNKIFSLAALGSLASRFTLCTPQFLVPLMLQASYGFTAFHAGLFTIPTMLGALASRRFITSLIDKLGYRRLLVINSIILFIIFASYSANAWHLIIPLLLTQQFCFAFCSGFQRSSMNALAYQNLENSQINHGTTIYSAMLHLSDSFGIAFAALVMVITVGHANLSYDVPTIAFKVVFIVQAIFLLVAMAFFSRLHYHTRLIQ